ncbi:SPFH domain / Band 7 family protein [Caballeronia arvi]|uniref:SPFH domain / Band 7 family protein n=1 Tax=Caballeronia arvi TaxID=1777135 RepID=A0A158JXQ7_9BURK|nr:prohibitin family protein [Caballeronia arvi]SAL73598.1 SPFH domain / Band 7 family protein [Caballeronia arvi]
MSTVDPIDGEPSEHPKRRVVRHVRYRMSRSERFIAVSLIVGVIVLALIPFVFIIIPAGHVGVLYRLLRHGTETQFVYHEGLNIKWPFDRIYTYEVRTKTLNESVHALATDGLSVQVQISVLYRPVADSAGRLHQEVGYEYVDRVVRPISLGAVRDIIGKSDPHDLYRINVEDLEGRILDKMRRSPSAHGLIIFERVVVRDLDLPATLNDSINRKLTEEQNALAYQFLIEQAKDEAERKRIEAIGIQTFYAIVANALTPQLLTWRGIEATVELSRSNNSKIVVVGSGKEQLPLILGSDIAKQPDLPPPAVIDPQSNRLPPFRNLPKLFPKAGDEGMSGAASAVGASGASSDRTSTQAAQPDAKKP